jgi:hypothetical protein
VYGFIIIKKITKDGQGYDIQAREEEDNGRVGCN